MPLITSPIKNINELTPNRVESYASISYPEVRRKSTISQVTEPLKEQILNGTVRSVQEMKAWLQPLGYSNTINEAAINFILREFVMNKVSSDGIMNMEMVVDLLRSQFSHSKKDIEPIIIMGLYHHRDLIGSPSAFTKTSIKLKP